MRSKGRKKSLEELARLGPDDLFLQELAERQSKSPANLRRAVRAKSSDGRSFCCSCIFSGLRMRAALRAGADPVACDKRGQGPIHWASRIGCPDALAALLEAGADPNAALPDSGCSALHLACFGLRPERVSLLLAAGADPLACDGQGRTPEQCAKSALDQFLEKNPSGDKAQAARSCYELIALAVSGPASAPPPAAKPRL